MYITCVRHQKGQIYNLRGIPVDLWKRVAAKARAEGHTMRWIILKLLEAWVKEGAS